MFFVSATLMLHFFVVSIILHLAYVFFECLKKFLPASSFYFKPLLGENNSFVHFKVQQVFTMANLGVLQELHQWSCKSKGEVRRCCHATNYSDTIRLIYCPGLDTG